METIRQKGLRVAGTAAAVSAMLLSGTMLSGCDDSNNRTSSDEVKQTAAKRAIMLPEILT